MQKKIIIMNTKVTDQDVLFHFCSKENFVPNTHISYYGWEFGIKHKFYNYIKGYRESAECVYQRFVQSQIDNRIDIQDTICYPLIFIHRHCFELGLKFLYINLFEDIEPNKVEKLLNKSHDLLSIWNFIKNDIRHVAKRINFSIDYEVIEKYAEQFNKEDKGSFCYRYPIKKKLVDNKIVEVHTTWKYLDIVNFHKKMTALLDYLEEVSHSIDSQLTESKYDEEFNKQFNSILLDSKGKIRELFAYYDEKKNREKKNKDKKWLQMSDIQMPTEEEQEKEFLFINSFSPSLKSLLITLCYAGQYIDDIRLAANKDERLKDVYRLLFAWYSLEYGFEIDDDYKNHIFRDTVMIKSRYNKQRILKILAELNIFL